MQDVILRPFSRRAEGDVGRTCYLRKFMTTFVNAAFITFVNKFSISFKLNVYMFVHECFTKLFLINIKLVYECLLHSRLILQSEAKGLFTAHIR